MDTRVCEFLHYYFCSQTNIIIIFAKVEMKGGRRREGGRSKAVYPYLSTQNNEDYVKWTRLCKWHTQSHGCTSLDGMWLWLSSLLYGWSCKGPLVHGWFQEAPGLFLTCSWEPTDPEPGVRTDLCLPSTG